MMTSLTLGMDYWALALPRFIQGFALGFVFVPLSTLTLATIRRDKLVNATAVYGMSRNIGGSVGIAVTGTLLTRQRQTVAAVLGEHITIYDPASQTMLQQLKAGFMARGVDAVTAGERAYAALHGILIQQASMVSFVWLFQLLGTIFLLLIPLILLMRRPKGRVAPAAAH
jgi:DHA2 family multidrug resistance protein